MAKSSGWKLSAPFRRRRPLTPIIWSAQGIRRWSLQNSPGSWRLLVTCRRRWNMCINMGEWRFQNSPSDWTFQRYPVKILQYFSRRQDNYNGIARFSIWNMIQRTLKLFNMFVAVAKRRNLFKPVWGRNLRFSNLQPRSCSHGTWPIWLAMSGAMLTTTQVWLMKVSWELWIILCRVWLIQGNGLHVSLSCVL